jgi:hypothetical protein
MPSTIRPDSGQSQHPSFDRVTIAWARLRGLSPSAAKSDLRARGLRYLLMLRFFSREGAVSRAERWQVLAANALRPTGALDCSDQALHESGIEVHEADQLLDSARYFTALDGPLPIEEETELRAIYRAMGKLRDRAAVIEARQEARRI